MKLLEQEKGFTLLEAIVSLLLITIILITLFGFFIQSKKTNSSSESISETTYIAQKEMEQIYTLSKSSSLSNLSSIFLPNYKLVTSTEDNCSYTSLTDPSAHSKTYIFEKNIEGYTSKITISTLCNYTKAGNVLIEITNSNNIKKAIIENIYIWK